MFKRFTIALLTLSFLVGIFVYPGSSTTAYANEMPNQRQGTEQAFSAGDDTSMTSSQSRDIDLPHNPPKVNLQGLQQLPDINDAGPMTTPGAPGINAASNDVQRYTVLVLDTSSSSDFVDSSGRVFYTANTALSDVKTAAKSLSRASIRQTEQTM